MKRTLSRLKKGFGSWIHFCKVSTNRKLSSARNGQLLPAVGCGNYETDLLKQKRVRKYSKMYGTGFMNELLFSSGS